MESGISMLSTWQTAKKEPNSKILCYHTNSTHQLQMIRVTDGEKINWEKMIFPRQRILFQAAPQEQLEIYIGQSGKPKCLEIISCQSLQVDRVPSIRTATKTISLSQDKSA